MKSSRRTLLRLVVSVCLLSAFGCVSYPKEVQKALTRAYVHDFPSYSFRGSPVGNFGVGTIYADQFLNKEGNSEPQESWLMAHPNTWYADSLSDEERNELDKRIFEIGSMGKATLKESISTSLKLSVSVPNLAEVLDAGATVSYEKGVKVTLKASEADNRQMNWSEFKKAVVEGKMQTYVNDLISGTGIVVASHDIILLGYSAEIQVDQSVNPELNAKLNNAIGKTLGVDSKLTLGVTKKSEGVFEVTTTKPVVAAVLYVRPPKTSDIRAQGIDEITQPRVPDSLDRWEHVVIENKVLDPIEKFLSDKGLPMRRL